MVLGHLKNVPQTSANTQIKADQSVEPMSVEELEAMWELSYSDEELVLVS